LRQKSKCRVIGNTSGDIRRDLTRGQLGGIGAVAMAWNSVESFLDGLLLAGLGLPARIGEKVIARTSGLDAKIELIRFVAETRLRVSGEQCEDLLKSLNDVKELKQNRDAVIHGQLIDVGKGLGRLIKRDARYDVLLSQQALDGLFDRLISVRDELRIVCLIFLILDEALKNESQADPSTLLHGQAIQGHVSQVQEHRKTRQSLPPLPKFPQ
jgi:hypothetical protein